MSKSIQKTITQSMSEHANESAQKLAEDSGSLPHTVSFTVGTGVTVFAMWKDPNVQTPPTTVDVVNKGFPIKQSAPPVVLSWVPDDGTVQDPAELYLATADGVGDLRMIA
jgi:hypothetical protein